MNPISPILKLFPLTLLVGCALDDLELGTTEQAVTSENRLSGNRLSGNGAKLGRVGSRRLSQTSARTTATGTVWDGDPVALSEMLSSVEGRDLLAYSTKCALPEGERLVVTAPDGITYSFPGLLDVVPDWAKRDLDSSRQKKLTGCLLAHTNFFGITVPISVRGEFLDDPGLAEQQAYPVQEAAFFGNVFSTPPVMSSCVGSGIVTDNPSSYLDQRVCAQEVGTTNLTTCGFVVAGSCTDTCKTTGDGDFKDCIVNGVKYDKVITVYLKP